MLASFGNTLIRKTPQKSVVVLTLAIAKKE